MASSWFLTGRQVVLLTVVVVLSTTVSANTSPPRICQADIAILVDCSGSIKNAGEENWGILLDFVTRIVRGVGVSPNGNRIGEVFFSNNAYVHFDFKRCDNFECVERLVNSTPYSNQKTNTSGAFRTAVRDLFNPNAGDRPDVRDIIIIITDGKPNPVDPNLVSYVRDTIRRDRKIRVYGVGITNQVDTALMKALVTPPSGDTYFNVSQFSELQTVLEKLIEQTCTDPEISTPAPTPAPTTTTPAPTTTTPAPTTARQISPGCTTRFDVVFILDSSGSIREENFNLMKGFVTNLVNEFPVDEGNVRVGLETYSTTPQTEFNLNRYTRRSDIASHLNRLFYRQGTTDTAAALRNVYEQMFTTGAGDRANVVNIIVVMTDGGSNNRENTINRANMAKSRGIHIIVVGIGKWTVKSELRAMASYPYTSNLVEVDSFQGLSSIRSALRSLICNRFNGCASNPCIRGSCVNEIGSYRCTCPNNFMGERCERQCRNGADIIFAIDKSGSIGKVDFQLQIDFVRNIFARLNLASLHKVALASFSNQPLTSFHLNRYTRKAELLGATNVYYQGGSTNTAGVLQLIRNEMLSSNNGRRGNVPAVVVLLTDGRSNNPAETWRQSMLLRNTGTHVIAVGVGNNVRPRELEGIASSPNDVYRVFNFSRLDSITTELMDAVCNNNDACSNNNNPCQNGGVCTDTINGYTCSCRQGFSGPDCARRCSGQVDIGFIVDASGSIRNERWSYVKDFITNIISAFTVSDSETQIGALTWSNSATLQFNLNRYTNTYDVIQAIHGMNFVGGRTHTSDALRMGTNQLFNNNNGARDGIIKIAIVFTDGGSNINQDRTIPEAIRLRVSGVQVIVIALGDDINQLELRGIASEPSSANLFFAKSFSDLPGLVSRVQSATCDVIDECSSGPCMNGGICADGFNRFVCQCRRGITGIRCERQCNRQMDIAFVLDLSGSVDVVYEVIIAFTKLVVSGLPVGTDTQVALVSYADQAVVNFNLTSFSTVEGVRTAIAFQRAGGQTNTQAALSLVDQDVFSAARGDRPNIANKAVVVTDGGSNIRRDRTLPEAQNLRNRGVELFAVAIGDRFDMGEINGIASDQDSEHVIQLPNSGEVDRAANQLLDWLCNR